MGKLLKLAWRNIWRNKRRSLLTIAAIAFAILMVAVTRSLQYGTYDLMESLAVRLYHGEIQIHRVGFQEQQTLNYRLSENEQDWQELVASSEKLTDFCRRVTSFGLVSSDSGSTGALIVGIEPEKEGRVSQFSRMLQAGERLRSGDDHVVLIGQTLAKNLYVDINDSLVVLTQGYRNQMGADLYRIKGLIGAAHAELDRALMIMPLHNAQELFSLGDGITQVVLRTIDFRRAPELSASLSARFIGSDYEVLSWEEMMPELKQLIVIDSASGAIYLGFLMIVIGIEIFNASIMSIMERTREFGILQAIGMKVRQLRALIFLESLLKISLSVVLGLALAFAAVSLLASSPIPLPDEMREAYASYGLMISHLSFSTARRVYVEPILSVVVVAILALILPLHKATKLTPVDAFRKT